MVLNTRNIIPDVNDLLDAFSHYATLLTISHGKKSFRRQKGFEGQTKGKKDKKANHCCQLLWSGHALFMIFTYSGVQHDFHIR
jgi:hypothetical protein